MVWVFLFLKNDIIEIYFELQNTFKYLSSRLDYPVIPNLFRDKTLISAK